MTPFTRVQRLRYWFDNVMSAGTVALIGLLFAASAVMIFVLSLLVHATGVAPADESGGRPSLVALAWSGLMRTLDPGTMGADRGSWPFLFSMLAITLGGVFVVGTLIGLLTTGIESKVDELRKGRSQIVETGHSVILGWSPEVFTVAQEICTANSNRPRACIAILADRDKVEMEDEVRLRIPEPGATRIVCRRGNPADLTDLELVNPFDARAVVVLNPEGPDGDFQVIKTVLALTNNPRRQGRLHIVAKLREERNLQVARMVGKDDAQFVLAGDLIARITVQTCRQSGLSVVYTELMDFGGDEIYFQPEPQLVGRTFGEALLAYEDSCVMGLRRAQGGTFLNPPMDSVLQPGDQVIAISEDDDTVRVSGKTDLGIEEDAIAQAGPRVRVPERTMLLGWNERGPTILRELDAYVAPGSETTVVGPGAGDEQSELATMRNMVVTHRTGDITDRAFLEELDLASYHHVIALSPYGVDDPQEADGQSLITLLHLRDIVDRAGSSVSVVSEMRDVRNRALAEVTRTDDFIVSDRLLSLLLAQVAENRELMAVFEDIFDPEGSEIYLKPAGDYVKAGRGVNFYTVVEAARRRGEVAIGYRLKAHSGEAARSYGVVVNPEKSARVTFGAEDRIIVLAED